MVDIFVWLFQFLLHQDFGRTADLENTFENQRRTGRVSENYSQQIVNMHVHDLFLISQPNPAERSRTGRHPAELLA